MTKNPKAARIYAFGTVKAEKVSPAVLGGKGYSLSIMSGLGLPVPPGFTITTEVCKAYMACKNRTESFAYIDSVIAECKPYIKALYDHFGYMPLLSVRSGAPVSMPGMMDTILNVGLTKTNLGEWKRRLGPRTALDCQRRLIQMLGTTGFGILPSVFGCILKQVKDEHGIESDADMSEDVLSEVVHDYLLGFEERTQEDFPDMMAAQLYVAVKAVFDSWMNPRAVAYREINKISSDMGTAVTVQAMVFGNAGPDSATGVCFTRNPSTGVYGMTGEYLVNAQGEDVVAGTHTPVNLVGMSKAPAPWPKVYSDLVKIGTVLETHYKDMVDIEFTIQEHKLYVLQSRVGKRSAQAAFKIAADMLKTKMITSDEALSRLTVAQYKAIRRPCVDPAYTNQHSFSGLPACPGVAVGRPVFSAKDAVEATDSVILVTAETNPNDIAGMAKAVGILTQTGGATSHAAVVARSMDKPCVVGAEVMTMTLPWVGVSKVTIDGGSGKVWINMDVPVVDASQSPELATISSLCLEKEHCAALSSIPAFTAYYPHQHLTLAPYWGDLAATKVFIGDIMQAFDETVPFVLDMNHRWHGNPESDDALLNCFSLTKDDGAYVLGLELMLVDCAPYLKGLRICNAPFTDATNKKLRNLGLRMLGEPKTVADLFDGLTTPSTWFIENVAGGPEAYDKLMGLIGKTGVPSLALKPAIPTEYAVYRVLRGNGG